MKINGDYLVLGVLAGIFFGLGMVFSTTIKRTNPRKLKAP